MKNNFKFLCLVIVSIICGSISAMKKRPLLRNLIITKETKTRIDQRSLVKSLVDKYKKVLLDANKALKLGRSPFLIQTVSKIEPQVSFLASKFQEMLNETICKDDQYFDNVLQEDVASVTAFYNLFLQQISEASAQEQAYEALKEEKISYLNLEEFDSKIIDLIQRKNVLVNNMKYCIDSALALQKIRTQNK